jgi:hypothetical protein
MLEKGVESASSQNTQAHREAYTENMGVCQLGMCDLGRSQHLLVLRMGTGTSAVGSLLKCPIERIPSTLRKTGDLRCLVRPGASRSAAERSRFWWDSHGVPIHSEERLSSRAWV